MRHVGDRIVIGAFGALFGHLLENTPELRMLSQAAGYSPPLQRNQMLHDAIDDAAEAYNGALDGMKVPTKKAKVKVTVKKKRKFRGRSDRPDERRDEPAAPADEIIDMEQKPDGTFGVKS